MALSHIAFAYVTLTTDAPSMVVVGRMDEGVRIAWLGPDTLFTERVAG